MTRTSVVTLLWRNEDYAVPFLDSLAAAAAVAAPVELIAVQNGPDGYAAATRLENRLRGFDDVIKACLVRAPSNLGFAGGVNLGCRSASGDMLVVANLDLVFDQQFLRELGHAGEACSPPCFLAPSVTKPLPGRSHVNALAEKGEETGALRRGRLHRPVRLRRMPRAGARIPAGNGSCIVLGRQLYDLRRDAVGGVFDDEYHSYYEDVDLFWWAADTGVPVWFEPSIRVAHFQAGSFGGKYRFGDRTRDIQRSVMANYRLTVWKHANSLPDFLGWFLGEVGYLARCMSHGRLGGARMYASSWPLAVRRAHAIRRRRGSVRVRRA